MRVLHFSTDDSHGGAAKFAYRLHAALGEWGAESHLVVHTKRTDDPRVLAARRSWWRAKWHQALRHLPFVGTNHAAFTFNHDRESGSLLDETYRRFAGKLDLVCLHWITKFLTARQVRELTLRFQAPVLWHLLDQEPVTGGCHYSFGCDGFTRSCGHCPLLPRPGEHDESRQVWQRKQRYLADLPLIFVAPTTWCAEKIRGSSLFRNHRIERIPLPLDERVYAPADRLAARQALGLPADKRVILFGASYLNEPRKGGKELLAALRQLHAAWRAADRDPNEICLAILGQRGEEFAAQVPFAAARLGFLAEGPALARAYQAADLFVCPSLEDAGPMMIPEALLCGTPVAAFPTGGAPDEIETDRNGFLTRSVDPQELAHGLQHLLTHPRMEELRIESRRRAVAFHSRDRIVQRYFTLQQELAGELVAKAKAVPQPYSYYGKTSTQSANQP